jgi:hypothetical protein
MARFVLLAAAVLLFLATYIVTLFFFCDCD